MGSVLSLYIKETQSEKKSRVVHGVNQIVDREELGVEDIV